MHVAQISFFTDPHARRPEQLLQAWPSLVDVAESACRGGVRVSVIQASQHSRDLARCGVDYHFSPHPGFRQLLRSLAPDVLHIHGLDFSQNVASLAAAVPEIPILLQDHASRLPRPWRRSTWRRGLSGAAGIAFCSREQAIPFESAGLIPATTKIYEIPESTSRFGPGDAEHARRVLGISGEPLIVWVGHLDANKDPLSVLDGISRAARALPALQLYLCYGTAPLLRAVQCRIAADPWLAGKVHLLGRLPHDQIEQCLRAADLFVSGSHREGSGYSLIEALACGVPPVVTDIPSFRTLTDAGAVGALWPPGDPRKLCEALLSVTSRPREQMRIAARQQFEKQLSFDAVGRKLASAYRELLGSR